MRPLAKVTELSESEATRELLSLINQAGKFERQDMITRITGEASFQLDNTLEALLDFAARIPHDERCKQVYSARRTVEAGTKAYGVFDPDTDRRDMLVEGLQEAADLVFYLRAHVLRGGDPSLLRDALNLFRRLLDGAYERRAI